MTTTGRGAWSQIGKDNGEFYYKFTPHKALDGSTPDKGDDYLAVNLGVKSIQARLVELGFDANISNVQIDGIFGRKTLRMVKRFQIEAWPTASADANDGTVGTRTAPELFKGYIAGVANGYNNVDEAVLYGLVCQESGFDPGAVGVFTPGDHGLFQINTNNGSVTVAQAHDYAIATELMADRFSNAYKHFSGKGPLIRKSASIAQHNSPVWAQQYYDSGGVWPNVFIEAYVNNVLGFAAKYTPAVVA